MSPRQRLPFSRVNRCKGLRVEGFITEGKEGEGRGRTAAAIGFPNLQ